MQEAATTTEEDGLSSSTGASAPSTSRGISTSAAESTIGVPSSSVATLALNSDQVTSTEVNFPPPPDSPETRHCADAVALDGSALEVSAEVSLESAAFEGVEEEVISGPPIEEIEIGGLVMEEDEESEQQQLEQQEVNDSKLAEVSSCTAAAQEEGEGEAAAGFGEHEGRGETGDGEEEVTQ